MLEKLNEFEEAMKSAVEWFENNCNPHQKIVIGFGKVVLVSEDMGYPVEIKD